MGNKEIALTVMEKLGRLDLGELSVEVRRKPWCNRGENAEYQISRRNGTDARVTCLTRGSKAPSCDRP